ncbi:dematin-like isoform X3 [Sphaeramia orbicularis]|uniref:dematin-like isoform X3 n=1 Tax=Sphaeramia orbicularis TaxID=375764 RepID=UPI00117D715C|nr:dematin-like isoform X3 [Sphaeramia orbicularis]
MMPKQQSAHTSPGSVLSLRPSVPGSPAAAIVARVDDRVIGYKDLAALPRDKAILDIERPDLMIYQPHYCYSPLERCLSPRSSSPPLSPENLSKENRDWLEVRSPGGSSSGSTYQSSQTHSTHTPSLPDTPTITNTPRPPCSVAKTSAVQHFHRPENGANIYKKPPIYKQDTPSAAVPQDKHIQDLIIESSKFPAAQPPDPNQPSKIETEYWPCPPSLAVTETESRRRDQRDEDEEADEDLEVELWALQRRELNKIQSNLGKIILKEELEKSSQKRKRRTVPERSTDGSSGCRVSYFPQSSRSGLSEPQSTEFSSSDKTPAEPWTVCVQNGDSPTDRGTCGTSVLEPEIFPYEALVVTPRGRGQLPPGVDRTRLERHLSQDQFCSVFGMTLDQFERLSVWKRNDLKKRVCLF